MLWLILYVCLALFVSFLCSISEAVLLSIRRSYVQTLSEEKPETAKMLSGLLETLDRPLAAILSLNRSPIPSAPLGPGHKPPSYLAMPLWESSPAC